MTTEGTFDNKPRRNEWFYRLTPEIILLGYILLFLIVKNPDHPLDRVIMSDGKAYYAYLTNIFIYHDPAFKFVEEYEQKYYSGDALVFKEFRYNYDGKTLIKGFPGLAILFLPFFLIAHFLSFVFGFPTDGYSIIYQYSIGFGAIFYLWAGLKYLKKLLSGFGFSQHLTAAILFTIAFGTNIIYYTLKEGTMVHVYNFALVAAFIYYLQKSINQKNAKPLILTAFLFGLIVIVRPTNGLLLFMIPFVAGDFSTIKQFFKETFQKPSVVFGVLAAMLVFPLLTMLLWYWQSSHWIVYTYGEEGFNFLKPHFFQILFSFNKGWFVYTPLALVAMAGFVYLYLQNRFRFYWGLSFLVLVIYVASSWWVWHYTSTFGQRVFIDFYPFIAILLGFAYLLIRKQKILRAAGIMAVIFFVGLNALQFYQHYTFVFPAGTINFKQYKDSFFRLIPAPRVYFPEEKVVNCDVLSNDFEKDYGWLNYASVTDTLAFEGKFSSQAGLANEYSIGLYEPLKKHLTTEFGWVKVSCQVFSNQKYSDVRMVIDVESQGQSIQYKPFYLRDVNRRKAWTYLELAVKLPKPKTDKDMLRVYFFNTKTDEFFLVDNLKVEVLSLQEEFEFY